MALPFHLIKLNCMSPNLPPIGSGSTKYKKTEHLHIDNVTAGFILPIRKTIHGPMVYDVIPLEECLWLHGWGFKYLINWAGWKLYFQYLHQMVKLQTFVLAVPI